MFRGSHSTALEHTGGIKFGWKPLPLGFAGGLADPHAGFIRFGFRDYDPVMGRFTAKDLLGDTGGVHDLYDDCEDDPVIGRLFPSMV